MIEFFQAASITILAEIGLLFLFLLFAEIKGEGYIRLIGLSIVKMLNYQKSTLQKWLSGISKNKSSLKYI